MGTISEDQIPEDQISADQITKRDDPSDFQEA